MTGQKGKRQRLAPKSEVGDDSVPLPSSGETCHPLGHCVSFKIEACPVSLDSMG